MKLFLRHFQEFLKACINFSPALQGGGWMGGRRGGGGEERGGKPSQLKIQGYKLPKDGPDHATRLKGHRSKFQANNTQLVCSTQPTCQSWFYKVVNSPPKCRPLESGHRRHGVWIAIEDSYKLGQRYV